MKTTFALLLASAASLTNAIGIATTDDDDSSAYVSINIGDVSINGNSGGKEYMRFGANARTYE